MILDECSASVAGVTAFRTTPLAGTPRQENVSASQACEATTATSRVRKGPGVPHVSTGARVSQE